MPVPVCNSAQSERRAANRTLSRAVDRFVRGGPEFVDRRDHARIEFGQLAPQQILAAVQLNIALLAEVHVALFQLGSAHRQLHATRFLQ